MPRTITILGTRVDDVTYAEAVARVAGFVVQGGTHQLATVNPEFLMAARRDADFRHVLNACALNVPDGNGVLWAARQFNQPLRQRVAGVDLMQALCGLAGQRQWRVFFLGAAQGVAAQAAAVLANQHAGMVVAGAYAGDPSAESEMEIVRRVREAQPQLLFVAYGAPAQDKWLARNLPLIHDSSAHTFSLGLVGMGVGGSFDYVTGVQPRAPELWQRAGVEWLYRLLREPKRLKRQWAAAPFFGLVLLESLKKRRG